jgi:hypothetical protein
MIKPITAGEQSMPAATQDRALTTRQRGEMAADEAERRLAYQRALEALAQEVSAHSQHMPDAIISALGIVRATRRRRDEALDRIRQHRLKHPEVP